MDTAEVTSVPDGSAADRVYAHVKAAILARRYPPRALLTEGELAAAVGVSRTPVREALLRLQAEQLVHLLPKRGALVLAVTAEEAADVMETRRLIETHTIRKVLATDTRALVAELDERIAHMRAAAKNGDTAAYVAADREFHRCIVDAAANQILSTLYGSLRDRQLQMGVVNLLDDAAPGRASVSRMRTTIAEHAAIRDAVAARSIRAAEAAVGVHLDHAEHLLAHR